MEIAPIYYGASVGTWSPGKSTVAHGMMLAFIKGLLLIWYLYGQACDGIAVPPEVPLNKLCQNRGYTK